MFKVIATNFLFFQAKLQKPPQQRNFFFYQTSNKHKKTLTSLIQMIAQSAEVQWEKKTLLLCICRYKSVTFIGSLLTLFLALTQLVRRCFYPTFRQPLNGSKALKDGKKLEKSAQTSILRGSLFFCTVIQNAIIILFNSL